MTAAVLLKLLAMVATVAIGWWAARARWLDADAGDAARVLSAAAFTVFVPALLFRTTARLDFAQLPWRTLAAFFVPMVGLLLAVHGWQRWRTRRAADGAGAAAPAVRAIAVSFGNSVQVGIPFAAALFGEAGLGIHIALVSLHALVLLSVLTALAETDLARERARRTGGEPLARTLTTVVRNTVVHPVVLPVLAGLAWNLSGLGLHPALDDALAMLAAAVVPVCLLLIGVTLAAYGVRGHERNALVLSALKLVAAPALVLAVAHLGFGLAGTPLAVVVMLAAMPVGANALIFAQRYATLEAEVTAAIVFSTVAFAVTATGWLAMLGWIGA
jgi:malonate transporter and related proteins